LSSSRNRSPQRRRAVLRSPRREGRTQSVVVEKKNVQQEKEKWKGPKEYYEVELLGARQ
jgi:hypothetical protein